MGKVITFIQVGKPSDCQYERVEKETKKKPK